MMNGFRTESFERGVPMLPKPKSEAWLICAFREPPYQHCERLEDESGNDRSPQSLKSQLTELIQDLNAVELAEKVRATIDPLRIQMPSFVRFRDRLIEVIRA